jgi:hypothetical protein
MGLGVGMGVGQQNLTGTGNILQPTNLSQKSSLPANGSEVRIVNANGGYIGGTI